MRTSPPGLHTTIFTLQVIHWTNCVYRTAFPRKRKATFKQLDAVENINENLFTHF